jgi:hydrogenase maturation protease
VKKILIYGMGNPFRCDDTIGLKIAEKLKDRCPDENVTIKSGSIDGLAMLDEIVGFDKVILIDSIESEQGKPGDIFKITVDPSETKPSLSASHGIDFISALRIGLQFGYEMPEKIYVYAIEIKDNTTFTEQCTDMVMKSVPEVIKRILKEIEA